ncbi:unnamed protein product [Mytilus coruscus]|uniref:Uncharacterized protein n=1 Tax=Mytilus coruscus TaxID=42192 RepID=A0A6J8DDB5_MYTCO|nr:unnamed protein product [Mytilus coruscus]
MQTMQVCSLGDGAKQALQEWHYPGNKAPKKKRNKKKKPANDNSPHVNGDVSSAEIIPNGIVANDGAKQALQEWHYPGNKAPKKKRNKKKKPANDNSPHVNGDVSSAEIIPNGIVANGSIESDTEPVKTNSISDISSSVSSLSLLPTTCTVPSLTECDKVNHVAPTHTSQNSVSTQKHAKVNHVSPTNTSQNSVSTQKHAKKKSVMYHQRKLHRIQ